MVEYHPISAEDLSRLHPFGQEDLPGIFLGCVLYAGRNLERRHVGEKMDTSEIHAWRLDTKEVITAKRGEIFHLPDRRWKSKLSGGEEREDFRGESDGSPPPQDSLLGDGESNSDFWSISGEFIYRHHVEPRVTLYVPREESFAIRPRYIDVARTTSTTLDVMRERRIDDYWNIEGDRDLSDAWIHHIGQKTSRRVYMV